MAEEPASLSDGVDKQAKITGKQHRRVAAEDDADGFDAPNPSTRKRGIGVVTLSSTNPSDWSQEGVENIQQEESGESLRLLHRRRLWLLLKKLLLQHNWSEASGVLSVLLKATAKDASASRNRSKYWATLQLMRHIKGDTFNQRKIQNIFDLWMKKLGAMEKQPSRTGLLFCWNLYYTVLDMGI